MALSFVGSDDAAAPNGTDPSLTLPAGISEDDVVFVAYCCGDADNVDLNLAMITAGYSELADLFSDDDLDANLGVFRKVMGVTPDSTAVADGVGGADTGVTAVCHVWRGADTTTPEDVATTTATGLSTYVPDPPSLDWSSSGVVILAIGGNAVDIATPPTRSAPTNYGNMISSYQGDTTDSMAMMASRADPSDPEDPGVFGFSGGSGDSTSYAWCAATVAIRPAAGGAVTSLPFAPKGRAAFSSMITR